MNTESTDIRFLCELHVEEARRRHRAILWLSLIAILVLIALFSHVVSERSSGKKFAQINKSKNYFVKLISGRKKGELDRPLYRVLLLASFYQKEDKKRLDRLSNILWDLKRARKSDTIGTFRYLIVANKSFTLPEYYKDLKKLEIYSENHGGKTLEELREREDVKKQQTAKTGIWAFFREPRKEGRPILDLKKIVSRYGLNDEEKQLESGNGNLDLVIDSIENSLRKLGEHISANEALGLYEALRAVDKSIDSVHLGDVRAKLFEVAYEYRQLKSALASSSGLNKTESEKIKVGTNISLLDAIVNLVDQASQNIKDIERSVSAQVYGIPVFIPVTPLLIAVPIIVPLYMLVIVSMWGQQRQHVDAIAAFEQKLRGGIGKLVSAPPVRRLWGLSHNETNPGKSMQFLQLPLTTQVIALQLLVIFLYSYLLYSVSTTASVIWAIYFDSNPAVAGYVNNFYFVFVILVNAGIAVLVYRFLRREYLLIVKKQGKGKQENSRSKKTQKKGRRD